MHKQTSQELLVCASRLELSTYFQYNTQFPWVTHLVCTNLWRLSATATLSFLTHHGVRSLFKLRPFQSKGYSMGAGPLTSQEGKIFRSWQSYEEALQIRKEEAFLKEAQATVQARNPPKKENLMLKARPSGWPSMVLPWPLTGPYRTRRRLYSWFSKFQVLPEAWKQP